MEEEGAQRRVSKREGKMEGGREGEKVGWETLYMSQKWETYCISLDVGLDGLYPRFFLFVGRGNHVECSRATLWIIYDDSLAAKGFCDSVCC